MRFHYHLVGDWEVIGPLGNGAWGREVIRSLGQLGGLGRWTNP